MTVGEICIQHLTGLVGQFAVDIGKALGQVLVDGALGDAELPGGGSYSSTLSDHIAADADSALFYLDLMLDIAMLLSGSPAV